MADIKTILSSFITNLDRAKLWQKYLAGVFFILIGATLRIWPLDVLEARIPWLTFYPMVMIAALLGGLYVGLFSTFLTCIIISFLWQWLTPIPFLNDSFDYLGMVVFFFNGSLISVVAEAMKRAQAKAKREKEISDAANNAKSVFLANMSHELRTPLNAILGFSQLLKKSKEATSEQKEKLDIISRSGSHLLNLINNVLDISKIESGKLVLEESETDINQVVAEVKSAMNVKAIEKKLKFIVEMNTELPQIVLMDGIKLKQVLYNLVGNAIKFTNKGHIILRVFSVPDSTENKTLLKFEIEDTGPGIKVEERADVFQSFKQLQTRIDSDAGTGLGLTICKQYVSMMGGNIGVKGDYGKGSVFYFDIPVKVISTQAKNEITNYFEILGVEETDKKYRILIAEDQLENKILIYNILEPCGFQLRDASDGREAIEIFEEWKPDLIFMDIRMPEIDGKEATKIIREKAGGKSVKIVALTAHALEEERIEILNSGCDEIIRKPYQDTEIYMALAKYLGIKLIYADEVAVSIGQKSALTEQDFKDIPVELLTQLQQAVELLDNEKSISIINKISNIKPQLAEILSEMIMKIQYKGILNIIDLILEDSQNDIRK